MARVSSKHYLSSDHHYYGTRRNSAYDLLGSSYAHRAIWQQHHGVWLDPDIYIVHHKDHNKRNNAVCKDTSGHCLKWSCGNLGPMTRADHIREHKPGRMGGRRLPNKDGKIVHHCKVCGKVKSRVGNLCRPCYRESVV